MLQFRDILSLLQPIPDLFLACFGPPESRTFRIVSARPLSLLRHLASPGTCAREQMARGAFDAMKPA